MGRLPRSEGKVQLGRFFWQLLYRSLTWIVLALLLVTLPLSRLVKPRFAKWFRMRFWPQPLGFQPVLWFHAVSLGEAQVALALLQRQDDAKRRHTLVTCATQAGYHYLQDRLDPGQVRYLPWDLPRCYGHLFRGATPPDLVVVETEIWPTLFHWVTSQGARLIIINGRLSHKTMRWAKNPLLRSAMQCLTAVACRSESDAHRFEKLGVPTRRLHLTGNIKYDYQPPTLPSSSLTSWLAKAQPLVIFASIATDEIPLLVPAVEQLRQQRPDLFILWAPRQLRDSEKHLAALTPFGAEARSRWQATSPAPPVLLLDTLGELAGCYGAARLSLVGGSFNDRGGQNFLESLQAGTPALVGPSTENFRREVIDALAAGVIRRLDHANEAADLIILLLKDTDALAYMERDLNDFLAMHTGAIARTEALLIDLGIYPQDGEAHNP